MLHVLHLLFMNHLEYQVSFPDSTLPCVSPSIQFLVVHIPWLDDLDRWNWPAETLESTDYVLRCLCNDFFDECIDEGSSKVHIQITIYRIL